MRKRSPAVLGALAVAVAITVVGCTSPNSPNAKKSEQLGGYDPGYTCSKASCPTALTAGLAGGQSTFVRNFNPFSPTATSGTFFLYEPLWMFNILKEGEFIPWLADKPVWSPDGKKITIKLNDAATWSDGSPVTADDLVFTLEALKKDPELQKFEYVAAKAVDAKTAEITFAGPAYTLESTIGGVSIVPKKIWESQDLKKWTNPEPVVSGPYKLGQFSSQQVVLQARADYWKQKVPVPQIKIPILGQAEEQKLMSGELEWSGGAIPNVKKVYVDKDPKHNHAWYPSYGSLNVYYNPARKPFDNASVRKGLSLAIDGDQVMKIVTQDLSYSINPTGMDQKTQGKWIAPQYKDLPYGKANAEAALAELAKAGYTKKGDQLVGPDGKQLTVDLPENAEYKDAIQRDQIIAEQWKKIGVKANVRPVPGTQLDALKKSADLDVTVGGAVYGANPWSYYDDILSSKNAGAWANYGSWKDPATDALLKKLSETGDPAEQLKVVGELQKVMVEKVPSFPVASIGASAEYNSKHWVGWPNEENPYAMPPPWAAGDNLRVVLSLKPNPDTYGS
ncbi:ABC transporter substrate-binding protein [Kribbella catacumbae]|uniref:ABC transporter substrate-binding protein n=1 Tax=Kribbella catacumbae TaxID=460086 RepID=UPI000A0754BF|nr:ABC transporter substrate-binding protein [Kribbella catacumbae]